MGSYPTDYERLGEMANAGDGSIKAAQVLSTVINELYAGVMLQVE
jgi:hypothetical protein